MPSTKRKIDDSEATTDGASSNDRRLYCLCKTLEDPNKLMIQCDLCDDWFHPVCVSLDDEEARNISKWFCPGCFDVMKLNPTIQRKRLLGFQGRSAPTTGWSDKFPITDIDERVIVDNVKTKRHKVEGWTLFREGKVVSLSSNTVSDYIYFRAQCQAAMRQQTYSIYVCFKEQGAKLKWGTCSCPAGIDGQCKHLVATLYSIIDLHRQDVSCIPEVQTCTEKLQMWHVRKPTSDEPLLFSDINFVKHDPEKPVKRDLCAVAKNHNPVPEFAKGVTSDDLRRLVSLYDVSGIQLPVLETIRSNSFQPVLCRQTSDADLHADLFNCVINNVYSEMYTPADLSPEASQHYSHTVQVDLERAKFIEKNTRVQSKTSFWFDEREYRITASNFGTFCRLRDSTDPVKTFHQKKKFFTTKSVRHGINYEAEAFAKYQNLRQCTSCPVGLVVNPSVPHIAVTPDRLVKVDNSIRLVEIKCPYSIFKRKTSIASQAKDKSFYLQRTDDKFELKSTHDYYYQVQGQLNLCGIDTCDFIVYVPPDDIVIIEVKRDEDFFRTVMLPKLNDIYFNHLLPHFVTSLYSCCN
ncbi:hypothetical protein FSP39_007216 [Pinctada imbricata]|uniref:Uncharacterized protein n=1 Tax=Pinctada imbricata TaxID=66713 RepID=A0AA89C6I7_PINIB|nr:hypothetical protein FSP39_007216 [Pinctada imbricata]